MSQDDTKTAHCAICGRSDEQETRSDHLRTVYVRSGELDAGYFRPRLSPDEMFSVKACGDREVCVCSNRKKCRARRRTVADVKNEAGEFVEPIDFFTAAADPGFSEADDDGHLDRQGHILEMRGR